MALIYATTAALGEWTGGAVPSNATQLLRSASLLVTQAVQAARYAVDTDSQPTDPKIAQAFSDAVCAQVTVWAANNIDPSAGGIATSSGAVRSKKIGSASLDYDTTIQSSVAAYNARAAASRVLCDESLEILRQSGLNLNSPWVIG